LPVRFDLAVHRGVTSLGDVRFTPESGHSVGD